MFIQFNLKIHFNEGRELETVHFVHFSRQFIRYHFLAEPLFTIFLIITVTPLNLCLFLLEQSCLSKPVEASFCLLCSFCVTIKTPTKPYGQRWLYVCLCTKLWFFFLLVL